MHIFLRTCIYKYVSPQLAWDEVSHITCAANNFVHNKELKESAFSLMFRRNAYTPQMQLLNPMIRYIGDDKSLLTWDALKKHKHYPSIISNCLKKDRCTSFQHILYLNFILETKC